MLQGLFLLFTAAVIVANLVVRSAVRLPRSEGAGRMSDADAGAATEAVRARAIVRARRRKALGARVAHYRSSFQGMVGLVDPHRVRRASRWPRR